MNSNDQPANNKSYTIPIIVTSLIVNFVILLLFFSPIGYKHMRSNAAVDFVNSDAEAHIFPVFSED